MTTTTTPKARPVLHVKREITITAAEKEAEEEARRQAAAEQLKMDKALAAENSRLHEVNLRAQLVQKAAFTLPAWLTGVPATDASTSRAKATRGWDRFEEARCYECNAKASFQCNDCDGTYCCVRHATTLAHRCNATAVPNTLTLLRPLGEPLVVPKYNTGDNTRMDYRASSSRDTKAARSDPASNRYGRSSSSPPPSNRRSDASVSHYGPASYRTQKSSPRKRGPPARGNQRRSSPARSKSRADRTLSKEEGKDRRELNRYRPAAEHVTDLTLRRGLACERPECHEHVSRGGPRCPLCSAQYHDEECFLRDITRHVTVCRKGHSSSSSTSESSRKEDTHSTSGIIDTIDVSTAGSLEPRGGIMRDLATSSMEREDDLSDLGLTSDSESDSDSADGEDEMDSHWMLQYLPRTMRTGKFAETSESLSFITNGKKAATYATHKKAFMVWLRFLDEQGLHGEAYDPSPFTLETLKEEDASYAT